MELLSIKPSTRAGKRYEATFSDGNRIIKTHFGMQGGHTFIDHHDTTKKRNYIRRHIVLEDWSDPTKAGTLSRFLLWNKKTLQESITDFKTRFRV